MLISVLAGCSASSHTFEIGRDDFLLDGKPFLIRSGEMHAARIPPEYWRHRLQMVRAMGCNTVCAYLFWNQHEPWPGEFDFTGAADVAEYCRLAQSCGLKVILRPGPYSCAEWEFGGFPWWLLKTPDIALRTRDPRYLEALRRYILRVGRELAPLQVTRGGPIIMVQVENEYGSYGNDKEYIGLLRDYLVEAGFDVPLFTCDGPSQLKNDTRDDLFCVVNFGSDPEANFKALREIRPTGPLMCGEYYPGWFDSWGKPHHTGDAGRVARELEYMLTHNASFSIYMAHGGTSFGFSAGANAPPFSPQTTSYDYDAPIDEVGRPTPKFDAIRGLFARHLQQGETLPEVPPPPAPLVSTTPIELREAAPLLEQLCPGRRESRPRPMEEYDQPGGLILYRTQLPAGEAATLTIDEAHDIAQVFLGDEHIATLDRRHRPKPLSIPARNSPQRLDILVEAMGRVNYGPLLHDRKGITKRVALTTGTFEAEMADWEVFCLPLDAAFLAKLRFEPVEKPIGRPAVYRGVFEMHETGDMFLDMRGWSRGAAWINGHNLGRYWFIGPQQTLYLPGCWLRRGDNEILVLDVDGGAKTLSTRGLDTPILNEVFDDGLGPKKFRRPGHTLRLDGLAPTLVGSFSAGEDWQELKFEPVRGRYFCLDAQSSQSGDPFTTCAEIELLDDKQAALPRTGWSVLYADSEEVAGDDGSAANVLDAQPTTFWHTQWESARPAHPHQVVIDLGAEQTVAGLRYLPRQDSANGRIRDFRLYVRPIPFPEDATEALPKPSAAQLAWHDLELGMFIHLAPQTWQDSETDNLSTPLSAINPEKLDTDQWVRVAQSMGAKYIIFVAKHEGGFCWWQTATTDYSVRRVPWRGGRGDVMRDLSESCRRAGMKLGVYLSPRDLKHGVGIGGRAKDPSKQAEYERMYRAQLVELLTRYGDMMEVWFDGSLVFDVCDILSRHAPNAVIFQGPQATIRWVGNEEGVAPDPAWNTVRFGKKKWGDYTAEDGDPVGDRWLPNECDARIRATWFWKTNNESTLKSVEQLMEMYDHSVGRGAVLLLNNTPDRSGLIPEADARRTAEFGDEIRRRFGTPLAEASGPGPALELMLEPPVRVDHVVTMEDISQGERVRAYVIEGLIGGTWRELARGTAIGHKKIDRFSPVEVAAVRLRVTAEAAPPRIRSIGVYGAAR